MKRLIILFLLITLILVSNISFASTQNNLIRWAQLKIGQSYTMGIKTDGSLWGWGLNDHGQLGDGTRINRSSPVKIMDNVAEVIPAGTTFIIKKDGSLWACGYNNGAFMSESTDDKLLPVKLMDNVSQVGTITQEHREGADIEEKQGTMVLKNDGSLWAWPIYKNYISFTKDFGGYKVQSGKSIFEYKPTKVASSIKCLKGSYVIKNDNTLCTIDDIKINGAKLTKIMDNVSTLANSYIDFNYTMIIKDDKSLWAWGQLSNGAEADISKPIKILSDVIQINGQSMALKDDGTVWAWGVINNTFDNVYYGTASSPVKIMDNVKKLGEEFIIKDDGSLWAWGLKDNGHLGNGTLICVNNLSEPVKILDNVESIATNTNENTEYRNSNAESFAIKTDGSLWAWGDNEFGQIGCGIMGEKQKPVKIMTGVADFEANETRRDSKYAIKDDGSLWAWGDSIFLGNGTEWSKEQYPVKVIDSGVITVDRRMYSDGDNTASVIKNDGSLWACGENKYGQIGDGTTEDKLNFIKIMDNVSQVSPGNKCTFVVKKDNSLWAYGYNGFGQIGIGKKPNVDAFPNPIKVMDNVQAVSTNRFQTAAIKIDGSLYTWGYSNGYPGDGTKVNKDKPTKILDNVSQVSLGFLNSIAIKKDGTLWGWGSNSFYELGNGSQKSVLKPIKILDGVSKAYTLERSTFAIKTDRSLWVWGDIGHKDTGDEGHKFIKKPSKILDNVADLYIGDSDYGGIDGLWHVFILKKDNSLWGMGNNYEYQLGDGTTTFRPTPVKIVDNVLKAGQDCALKKDGSLWTWGNNWSLQIGDGSGIITSPVQIK